MNIIMYYKFFFFFFFNETGTFSLTPPTPSFPMQSHSTGLCMVMVYLCLSYPKWASLVAQMVKNFPAVLETWFNPWVGKIP